MGGAIGGIFNVIGDQAATSAEVSAMKANANWFMEQADFAHRSTVRELNIQKQESTEFYGQQVSGIARGGLDLSGSPLLELAQTKMRAYQESQAILDQGNMQYKEASLRSQIASTQADNTRAAGSMRAIGGTLGIVGGAFSGGYSARGSK